MTIQESLLNLIKTLDKNLLYRPDNLELEAKYYKRILHDTVFCFYGKATPLMIRRSLKGSIKVMEKKYCSFPIAVFLYNFYERNGSIDHYLKEKRKYEKDTSDTRKVCISR